jgi:hypothetical protein
MNQQTGHLKKETASEKMTTLSDVMNHALAKGYIHDFKVEDNGMLWDCKETNFHPDEVVVDNFYRFEGESDSADNTILYLIRTEDGRKGMLIDAYGAYDDALVSEFIREVTEIQKKGHHVRPGNRKTMALLIAAASVVTIGLVAWMAYSRRKKARSCAMPFGT